MNTIEIITYPIRGRGRPLGVKNYTSIEEYKAKQISRKKNLQVNFQRYKAENHEELKKAYLEHYYSNKDMKLKRLKEMYGYKCHIQKLMNLDISILG